MTKTSIHQIYNEYFDALSTSRCDLGNAERMKFTQSNSDGYIDRIITPSGIVVVDSEYRFKDDRQVRIQSEASMIELSFCMQGSGTVQVKNDSHELMPDSCSLQLMHNFHAEFYYRNTEPIRLLSIGIPVSLFESWMVGKRDTQSCNLSGLLGSQSFRMFRMPILSDTVSLLALIRDCPYHSAMRQLYAEGKALELIAAYVGAFLFEQSHLDAGKNSMLSRRDVEKVWKARDIILLRMSTPPSLVELSRLAGINEYKLKIGFKQEFGTSVFAYLRNKRLEKAWEMLHSGTFSVSQTAIIVGYNNFSHFAEAFRKQYGINPSEILKKL
jgi:AraC-like DNA-binding protein